jgi:transcriptional regulator with XRE-family HTH domain
VLFFNLNGKDKAWMDVAAACDNLNNVTFTEKLKRATQDLNKAKASISAGLAPTTISNYIATGSTPRADIALKIARAIGVPLDWLVDDTQDWPPPESRRDGATSFTDQQLLHEIATRLLRAVIDLRAEANRAKAIDWKTAAHDAARVGPRKPLPDSARQAMLTLSSFQVKLSRILQEFDVDFYAIMHHADLPGAALSIADVQHVTSGFVVDDVASLPGVSEFADAIRERPDWNGSDLKNAEDFYERQGMRRYMRLAHPTHPEGQSDRTDQPI